MVVSHLSPPTPTPSTKPPLPPPPDQNKKNNRCNPLKLVRPSGEAILGTLTYVSMHFPKLFRAFGEAILGTLKHISNFIISMHLLLLL